MKYLARKELTKDGKCFSYVLKIWPNPFNRNTGIQLEWNEPKRFHFLRHWFFQYVHYREGIFPLWSITFLGFSFEVVGKRMIDHWDTLK